MTLDDLKQVIKNMPISSILERYINVVRKGKDTKACCPFHDDRDPSLNINDNKGMYWCFPCNDGGDAINFVMKLKHVNYIDALKDICSQTGINFEDYDTKKVKDPKREKAKELLTRAAEYYRKQALTGKFPAYEEFVQKRELPPETLERYKIGYSPYGNKLSESLLRAPEGPEKNFTLNIAQEIGLIGKNDRGDYYDFFRERIMFPVCDASGTVIAFSARATRPEDEKRSKYINSKNSFMFNKSQALFGLNLAKSEIRAKDAVIILEGQMDQIMMNRHGFENGVASLGTAFTEENFRFLLNLSRNFYLAMDSDNAGLKAAHAINLLCLKEKIIPKILEFKPCKDPDEFLKTQGKMQMLERLERARPFIDVAIDKILPQEAPQDIEEKLKLLDRIFALLAPLGDDVRSEERIKAVVKRLQLASDPETVMEGFRRFIKKGGPEQRPQAPRAPSAPAAATKTMPKASVLPQKTETKYSKAEKNLLEEVSKHPELLSKGNIGALLDFVEHDEVKTYVSRIREFLLEIDDSGYKDFILEFLANNSFDEELGKIVRMALVDHRQTELNEKAIEKHLASMSDRLKLSLMKKKREDLMAQMKALKDENEKDAILTQLDSLLKEMNSIQSSKK